MTAVWGVIGVVGAAFGLWALLLIWTTKRDGWPKR